MYSCWARGRVCTSKAFGRRGYGGEKQVPRCSRERTNSGPPPKAGTTRHRGARGHRAVGLKTAATTGEKQVPRSARDDMAHWRSSTKVKEHKQERSLERLVDM